MSAISPNIPYFLQDLPNRHRNCRPKQKRPLAVSRECPDAVGEMLIRKTESRGFGEIRSRLYFTIGAKGRARAARTCRFHKEAPPRRKRIGETARTRPKTSYSAAERNRRIYMSTIRDTAREVIFRGLSGPGNRRPLYPRSRSLARARARLLIKY